MKCQKCNQIAAVHLTEIVTDHDGTKRPMEVHLCLAHAVEAGLVAAETEVTTEAGAPAPEAADAGLPTAIVPAAPAPTGLTVVRNTPAPSDCCPVCGMSWQRFRQTGLMGCPHDYEVFEGRLLPLLKRAQEGAGQHAGKVPVALRQSSPVHEVLSLRLRRELQHALDAENYEQAARLRDQLKNLKSN